MADRIVSDPNQARARLIDHFKRAYQIIVGLAITLACTKLFTSGSWLTFWLFSIFFITVVPIFHGGDRSLDVKYLANQPQGFWGRASYVWDVYMLLISAILFVKLAQAIPGVGVALSDVAIPTGPVPFYQWMTGTLLVDIAILIIDSIKTRFIRGNITGLGAYLPWGIMNTVLALICYFASIQGDYYRIPETACASIVFTIALIRTILDYYCGRDFLFP